MKREEKLPTMNVWRKRGLFRALLSCLAAGVAFAQVAAVGTKGHGAHTANEYDYVSSMDELKTYLVRFLRESAAAEARVADKAK